MAIQCELPNLLPGPNPQFRFIKNSVHTSLLGSLHFCMCIHNFIFTRYFMIRHDKDFNVLSFYRSKMISDHPNWFGRLQIILVGSKLFWSGPNHFDQVQIRLLWYSLYNLDPTKTILTQPKQIRPVLTICTQPKWFGRSKTIKEQDIWVLWKCKNKD